MNLRKYLPFSIITDAALKMPAESYHVIDGILKHPLMSWTAEGSQKILFCISYSEDNSYVVCNTETIKVVDEKTEMASRLCFDDDAVRCIRLLFHL